MAQGIYIPATPALREEQVASWAFQSGSWGTGDEDKAIMSHYSANAILDAVDEDEKPKLIEAWKTAYTVGKLSR